MKQDSHAGEIFLDLDPNTKYCLVDTMVLLPLRRGDPDVTRDIKTELNGATLVLLNRIVSEATNKHNELETGDDEMKYMDFVLSRRRKFGRRRLDARRGDFLGPDLRTPNLYDGGQTNLSNQVREFDFTA